MNIVDHGKWKQYVPSPFPENVPSNMLFARREDSEKDWYEFLKEHVFDYNTIKMTVTWHDNVGAYIVGAAVHDATMLFPQDAFVIEVTDYNGFDPQKDFGGKAYDPETKSFMEAPAIKIAPSQFEVKVLDALAAIMTRVEALEKKPK